jgi:hypothetical protein
MTHIIKILYNYFKKIKRIHSIKLCSFIIFIKSLNSNIIKELELPSNELNKDNLLILLNKLNLDDLIFYIDDIINILNNNDIYDIYDITINDIIEYHINNDTYLEGIEYYDYFSNNKLLEWIKNHYIFSNDLLNCIYKFTNIQINSYDNIVYKEIIGLVKMKDLLENVNNNNLTIDILKTDNNKKYDTIFAILPNKVTNIIHAQCCKKIKDLKIRGTKSEPLYLQYIMLSLNNNGSAIIIVPDHLLYNDSKQHDDTRKYLLENFNVKQIIQLSPTFFLKKNQKYSLLYFTKMGKTCDIEYLKLNSDYNLEKIGILEYNKVIINNNILFINYYQNKLQLNNNINNINITKKLNEIYNFTTDITNNTIRISKKFKNNSSIILYNKDEISEESDAYYLIIKDSLLNNEYFTTYILHKLKYKMNKLLKNNSNIYDIDEISQLCIPIIDNEIQTKIINYYNFKSLLINSNNEQINKFREIQYNFISLNIDLYNNGTNTIENICDIYSHNNIIDKNVIYIGIIKNSSEVGNMYMHNDNNFNSNSYYLSIKSNKITEYNIEYIYIWLKYNNKILFDIANNNTQLILNKTNINKFIIKNINYNIQENIILHYKKYDAMINKLQETNTSLYTDDDLLNI